MTMDTMSRETMAINTVTTETRDHEYQNKTGHYHGNYDKRGHDHGHHDKKGHDHGQMTKTAESIPFPYEEGTVWGNPRRSQSKYLSEPPLCAGACQQMECFFITWLHLCHLLANFQVIFLISVSYAVKVKELIRT